LEELQVIYKLYQASAKRELGKQGCTGSIFEELYHEAFLIYLERKHFQNSVIRFPLAYIVKMCKNLWNKERKRQATHERIEDIDPMYTPDFMAADGKMWLLLMHLKKLSTSCREILTLYSLGKSEDEISKKLNLRSTKVVNNKKNYCKELLKRSIKRDPLFDEINE
jgi:DNA-directed RNA polymerase specialized sigma24 family protein